MAETIALCRPDVVCAYPITPQTHIVEALSELVRTGRVGSVRVHQRGIRVRRAQRSHRSVCVRGESLHGDGKSGPALHGRSRLQRRGLGLPIVMTLGNRAIGAPINIWNDHSDAMSMRDAGWIQLFAKDEPGGGRSSRAGVPPRGGAKLPGDGVRRRIHSDACGRARGPALAGASRRVPSSLRAGPDARRRRARDDRGDGGPGGVHRSACLRTRSSSARWS